MTACPVQNIFENFAVYQTGTKFLVVWNLLDDYFMSLVIAKIINKIYQYGLNDENKLFLSTKANKHLEVFVWNIESINMEEEGSPE